MTQPRKCPVCPSCPLAGGEACPVDIEKLLEQRLDKVPKDRVEVPVDLAWRVMALLVGVVIEHKLEQLPYPTFGVQVRDDFSRLLEPHRDHSDRWW